jgi:hypothetical protein
MKFLATAFLLCSSVALASPAQVIMIRHAEKAPGNDLSAQGYQHAQELVPYFESDADVTQYGTPVAIYAMEPSSEDPSNRAVETVTPLAQALNLTVLANYGRDDYQNVVNEVMANSSYDGKMVLICWEHTSIPAIAAAFGVSPQPPKWDKDDYMTVFRIDFNSQGKVTQFNTFQQNLR